jgi:alpha-L-fucosidase
MDIMDFANDDNFKSSWISKTAVREPWWQVSFDREQPFNLITIVEVKANIRKYRIEYREQGTWKPLLAGDRPGRVKIHRFSRVWGDQLRIRIDESTDPPSMAEFGVYNER